VAVLGLGLAALGRPGYRNISWAEDLGADRSVAALRARAHEVLDAAWEAGVRHFDSARSHERVLGANDWENCERESRQLRATSIA
jgi:aryl-alcohol dehydrogenase-like predicted oxidoreductase